MCDVTVLDVGEGSKLKVQTFNYSILQQTFKKVRFWRLETFKSFKKVHFWRLETFKSFKNNRAEGLNYLSWRFLKFSLRIPKYENCYSSSTENGNFEALCARMHLSPQYFIIVKIIWVFLSYLFHRNLQKVLFLYKLSLKVANIKILQKPTILKVIFSKNLQKGSIWRLNAQKSFKNLRPEDWMIKKPSKTFDLKVQTFAQVYMPCKL